MLNTFTSSDSSPNEKWDRLVATGQHLSTDTEKLEYLQSTAGYLSTMYDYTYYRYATREDILTKDIA
jgi:hypothetical protein